MGLLGNLTSSFDIGYGKGDSSGIFGSWNDFFHGPRPPKPTASGSFTGSPALGADFSAFLRNRLNTPVEKSSQFQYGSEAIREMLSRTAGASRSRLGDVSRAGGFADSGAVLAGMGNIDRGELEAFSQGINQLIMELETQRTAEVLPFLMGASGESLALQELFSRNLLTAAAQSNQTSKDISSEARGWFGMFGGGGGIGG